MKGKRILLLHVWMFEKLKIRRSGFNGVKCADSVFRMGWDYRTKKHLMFSNLSLEGIQIHQINQIQTEIECQIRKLIRILYFLLYLHIRQMVIHRIWYWIYHCLLFLYDSIWYWQLSDQFDFDYLLISTVLSAQCAQVKWQQQQHKIINS